jgi:solute carrier family 35 protein F1/2
VIFKLVNYFIRFLILIKAQSIINYFLLAIVYLPAWLYYVNDKRKIFDLIKKNWWKYLLITLADVEANYLVIKAYSLTLLTTIQVTFLFFFLLTVIFIVKYFQFRSLMHLYYPWHLYFRV